MPSFLLSLPKRTTACPCDFGDKSMTQDALLRSPPAKSSHKNDLQRAARCGPGAAIRDYVTLADLRLICKNMDNNVYNTRL